MIFLCLHNVFELYELCNYKNSFIALIKVWWMIKLMGHFRYFKIQLDSEV